MGGTFVEGLVDAFDDCDFQSKSEALMQSWHNCEVSSAANLEGFITYFLTNKASLICDTMLRSIREASGLGCPPDIFTMNACESINSTLKHTVDFKQSELSALKVKEVVQEQQREVQRGRVKSSSGRAITSWKFYRATGLR